MNARVENATREDHLPSFAMRVRTVSRQLLLSQEEMGRLLETSQRTVSRWAAGNVTPPRLTKERLLELAYVSDKLSKVLRPEDANLWLYSPNELLGDESPAELIRRREFRKVLALIEALAEGVVF